MKAKIKELIDVVSKDDGTAHNLVRNNLLAAVNDPKFGMRSLVGRSGVMDEIAALLFAFSRNFHIFTKVFLNFAIMGSAGVGKSALARVLAFVFQKAFILVKGNIIMGTRQELVGEFVGQTAVKTRELLFSALEGILFIDEAYALTPCERDAGSFDGEAVTELINFMDKAIGLMVIMVAGYEREMMDCFFPFNAGLDRRFPHKLRLASYSSEDLAWMLIRGLRDADVKVDAAAMNHLYSIINQVQKADPGVFGNQAGDMLNLSNLVVQNIFMSIEANWDASHGDRIAIIHEAVSQFMESKGLHISF